ncbi:MAG: hypothetical protein ACLSGF_05085 [Alistipes onderdonkii]
MPSDASLNATHILNTYFVNMQYGSYSLTRQFVNTYLNRDGSRFTDKPGYERSLSPTNSPTATTV